MPKGLALYLHMRCYSGTPITMHHAWPQRYRWSLLFPGIFWRTGCFQSVHVVSSVTIIPGFANDFRMTGYFLPYKLKLYSLSFKPWSNYTLIHVNVLWYCWNDNFYLQIDKADVHTDWLKAFPQPFPQL